MSKKSVCLFLASLVVCSMGMLTASQRFVLTGAPCIGKSTVIKELEKRGYQTIPEVYTTLFEQACAQNRQESFLQHPNQRQLVLDEQIRMESLLVPELPAFLDRSAVDIIVFGDYYHMLVPDELRMKANRNYDLIFFLDPLPERFYENSAVRHESRSEALKIHEMLRVAYHALGYKPSQIIDVPFLTPEERAEFILESIKNFF